MTYRRPVAKSGRRWSDQVRPSSVLLTGVLAMFLVLVVEAFAFAHYLGVDVASSLTFVPVDMQCLGSTPAQVGFGIHCFSDYEQLVGYVFHTDPWSGDASNYLAGALVPQLAFAELGRLAGDARVGLVAYLILMAAAIVVPGMWASRGKSAANRVLLFGAFGIVSLPALMALDRGNSISLVVPALLAFLVGLRREKWWLAALGILAAALIKPQFLLLIVVLLGARRWRQPLAILGSFVLVNLLAYLLWPVKFPGTVAQSIQNVTNFAATSSLTEIFPTNVSFARGLRDLVVFVEVVFGHPIGGDFFDAYATPIATIFIGALAVVFLILGRRVNPLLVGIVIVAAASLCGEYSASYYLVFGLPVAAVILRDPAESHLHPLVWKGAFDPGAMGSLPRESRFAAVVVAAATVVTLTRLLIPVQFEEQTPGDPIKVRELDVTTAWLAPVMWMVAATVVIASGIIVARRTHAEESDLAESRREPASTWADPVGP